MYCTSTYVSGRMAAMRSIAVTTYDLEDREISAAGFTVFTLGGRMESEQVAELKELFDCD